MQDGESAEPQNEGDRPAATANPMAPPAWLRRHWVALLAGSVPGALIGLWSGYAASKGGEYELLLYLGGGTIIVLMIGLLIVAGLARQSGPGIAAAGLAAAFVLGVVVSPDAPGSIQYAAGTGEVATRADPTALWSGPVRCSWPKDITTSIVGVAGYHVPIADPSFKATRLADGSVDVSISFRKGRSALGYDTGVGTGQTLPIELLSKSADGRTGTAGVVAGGVPSWSAAQNARVAALTDTGIIFRWSCEGGP